MPSPRPTPRWLACVLGLLATTLSAADKIDLDRLTPVPASQPIPTQDFFRPVALAQPLINHRGSHIAAVVSEGEDKHLLMVYDITKGTTETVGGTGDKDIFNVHWMGDTRVLFELSSLKTYGLGIMAGDVGDLKHAYPLQQFNGSYVVSIPAKNPLFPLVWNRRDLDTKKDSGVVQLNSNFQKAEIFDLTASGSGYDLMQLFSRIKINNAKSVFKSYAMPENAGLVYRYMAGKGGGLGYAFLSDKGSRALLRWEGDQWVPCPVDLEQVDVLENATEPGQLLVLGPSLDGKPRPLQFLNPATGALGDVILQDQLYDFNGWSYHNPANGDLLGVTFRKGAPRVYWFNEEYKTLQKILDGMFPAQIVRIVGSDDHHKVFLVATFSDRQPAVYHWVNLETRKANIFKQTAPWIDPARMQPMQTMTYKTRDGQKLDAYLTLPAGTTKANPAPLVVLCHGGPWTVRDNWGFNGQVQFLVHHGYAVLQPNYRGSTGSVGRFPAGDQFDFIKMHDDVTDAAKTALSTGLVDPDRVGIMGGSFGGYLAVSGVAHEPGLYRCAVTNAGVFDWALQVQSEKYDQFTLPYYGQLVKHLGDPKVATEKYAAMSPLQHVKNIRVPVFVAGGTDDHTVELEQSKNLIDEFERQHVAYEKLFIGGEGHGMAHLKNQVELYDHILAFLDKNLRPRK